MNVKTLLFGLTFLMAFFSLKAQDCEKIMLPYFGNDAELLASCPQDKLAIRCAESRFSFDVADNLPEGAAVHDISEVVNRYTLKRMDKNVVINLDELSYYAYNFHHFRGLHYQQTVYFRTPGSEHPYLVLHSFRDTETLVNEWLNNK